MEVLWRVQAASHVAAIERAGTSGPFFRRAAVDGSACLCRRSDAGRDPVNSPLLVGYMVYYGPAAGNYTSSIDVGNTTAYTVSGLVEGTTYHFATTAYDAAHTQSGFSNDVAATVPYSAPVAPVQCQHHFRHRAAGAELSEHIHGNDHHLRLDVWRRHHREYPESGPCLFIGRGLHRQSHRDRSWRQQYQDQ